MTIQIYNANSMLKSPDLSENGSYLLRRCCWVFQGKIILMNGGFFYG